MKNKEQQLRSLYALLDRTKRALDAAMRQADKLDLDCQSIMRTIELVEGGDKLRQRKIDLHVSPLELKGMTQGQALVFIAERNKNRLKVAPARQLLIEAKLMKPGKNASNVMFTTIERSGVFQRVKRGEYRFLQVEPPATGALRFPRLTKEVSMIPTAIPKAAKS